MQLSFQSYGAGEPLIILHGLFGSRENWHSISRKLGETYHVFALDQRNHGASPHSDVFTYPAMAGDLRAFLDAQGLERALLLGHSMGGKTAMQFALESPERVEKLIIADIAPKAYPRHHDQILEGMAALDLATLTTRQAVEAALAPYVPNVAERQFLIKNLARDEHGVFRWKLNLGGIAREYEAVIAGVAAQGTYAGPTLFIRGGTSRYMADGDTALIRALFPRAAITTIPGAGHWLHAEAPAEFLRLVTEFLNLGK